MHPPAGSFGGSMSYFGPKPFLSATPPRWRVDSCGHWSVVRLVMADRGLTVTSGGGVTGLTWHARGHLVAIVVFPFFSQLRNFLGVFPCCCGSDARSTLRRP